MTGSSNKQSRVGRPACLALRTDPSGNTSLLRILKSWTPGLSLWLYVKIQKNYNSFVIRNKAFNYSPKPTPPHPTMWNACKINNQAIWLTLHIRHNHPMLWLWHETLQFHVCSEMKKAIYLDFVTCRYKMISLPFEKLSANSISNILSLDKFWNL